MYHILIIMEFNENNDLLSIKKENVPLFLQNSTLFRNFEEIDEYVSVPSKFFCNPYTTLLE